MTRFYAHTALVAVVWAVLIVLAPSWQILDARFYWTAEDAARLFFSLGDDGVAKYKLSATIDLVFVAVYTSWFVAAARRLKHKDSDRVDPLLALIWFPGFFDLIETSGILAMLYAFPSATSFATPAALATPLKWIATLVTVTTLTHRYKLR